MKTMLWENCYPSNWKGKIADEAIAHPAKFSSKLIRKIYEHMLEEGWLKPGDVVIDPFGGVALGAMDAMRIGCRWRGCELEPRFVDLGNSNIEFWNRKFGALPKWSGDAVLYQGDSRELARVLQEGGQASISSPPYADGAQHTGGDDPNPDHIKGGTIHLPGIAGAVSSPPYAESMERKGGIDPEQSEHVSGPHSQMNNSDTRYGSTPGQLGAMKANGFDASVSSPPFGDDENLASSPRLNKKEGDKKYGTGGQGFVNSEYGQTAGQLGKESGDDFWLAARAIVEQTYAVLAPGGHAVWVVKDFVKNKERMPFSDQWRQLCEAVGFVTLHEHHAMLVHRKGTQMTLDGGQLEIKTESKSFFRRLAEKKGSPRIDWETVWCMEKPK